MFDPHLDGIRLHLTQPSVDGERRTADRGGDGVKLVYRGIRYPVGFRMLSETREIDISGEQAAVEIGDQREWIEFARLGEVLLGDADGGVERAVDVRLR